MSYVGIILGSLSGTLAGPPGLPTALRRVTPAPLSDLYRFSNGETGDPRLGSSKVPQPSVDFIYMAAPACSYSLARSVCTAIFKVPTLTCCVLVWNGRGGIAIKEAWKESRWHQTKNVLNPANVESRYRGWLVELFDSI